MLDKEIKKMIKKSFLIRPTKINQFIKKFSGNRTSFQFYVTLNSRVKQLVVDAIKKSGGKQLTASELLSGSNFNIKKAKRRKSKKRGG